MKKVLLVGVLGTMILSACGTNSNYTSRRKLTGIDYSSYERASSVPGAANQEDFVGALPGPTVLEEPAAALVHGSEEPALSEYEEFTSEEIASSYGRYTDVTVVVAAKRIKLGPSANTQNMALFQKALDAAYKKSLRTYRPSGFTYSIASVGAVNPLSDIEVSCVLGEQSANEVGQQTCNLFFQTLIQQYNKLLQEAKEHAAL